MGGKEILLAISFRQRQADPESGYEASDQGPERRQEAEERQPAHPSRDQNRVARGQRGQRSRDGQSVPVHSEELGREEGQGPQSRCETSNSTPPPQPTSRSRDRIFFAISAPEDTRKARSGYNQKARPTEWETADRAQLCGEQTELRGTRPKGVERGEPGTNTEETRSGGSDRADTRIHTVGKHQARGNGGVGVDSFWKISFCWRPRPRRLPVT